MVVNLEDPVRRWDEVWMSDVDLPAGLPTRRRVARAEAAAHPRPVTPDGRGGVGLCRYGPGCIALALVGDFDRRARSLLAELAEDLPRIAHGELVIDLAGVVTCDAALVRAIGRLRIRALTREARVELHSPPPALAEELGIRPPVGDDESDTPPREHLAS